MDAVIAETIRYIEEFVEKPHPAFGGFAPCPFSKKMRLDGKIDFKVLDFFDGDPRINQLIKEFTDQNKYVSLFVIHPDKSFPLETLKSITNNLKIAPLVVFRGHPEDDFKVGDVMCRREPYPGFQILHSQLIFDSRAKLNENYFKNWDEISLQEVDLSSCCADDSHPLQIIAQPPCPPSPDTP